MLQPVPAPRPLARRQPCKRCLVDVVVVAVDVGVRVMGNVVLDPPCVAAESQQRISRPAHQVIQATPTEIRAVVGVVLNAKADEDRSQHEPRQTEHPDGDPRPGQDEDRP